MDASSPSVVDLTSTYTQNQTPPQYRRTFSEPNSSNENRGTKRRRLSQSSTGQSTSSGNRLQTGEETVESIDLTEVEGPSALKKALSKQREDAVKAQKRSDEDEKEGRSVLLSYRCPVCMDILTDATTTICGHLFCHECIINTLRFSEGQRVDSPGKGRGTCPVCRKSLTQNDTSGPKRNLVPLQLKLKKREAAVPESA
ncbi:SUMO-targeted ubiquitin ligase complex subunit slx8 [Monascus purpureus]|uniref:SUMO-targeted ubiquitin ligase complex subunit slx8 n=1 Tax=Monascus purpureus TaxID=5098 RepID=A0A507R2N4_MONPU|nr:SUMO-targeted ubiquitin ligase complex subunit slx8 [Monascus purpureus]BDD55931.1 hypothetical protein MAP00_001413 [Monascus purpureus]